jgi:hypothetical protein
MERKRNQSFIFVMPRSSPAFFMMTIAESYREGEPFPSFKFPTVSPLNLCHQPLVALLDMMPVFFNL